MCWGGGGGYFFPLVINLEHIIYSEAASVIIVTKIRTSPFLSPRSDQYTHQH